MCLLLAAFEQHPKYRLIVAANRDEFYDRPAAAAHYWEDESDIFGGRDLEAHGTWLAVNRRGQFGAITNVRTSSAAPGERSRGLIVVDYLNQSQEMPEFLAALSASGRRYDGFNLLCADAASLGWCSNQSDEFKTLEPGVYGLSNASLDTPWPKVRLLKYLFDDVKSLSGTELTKNLFEMLSDSSVPTDTELPDTGVGLHFERVLSPIFIEGENYGTRCSTVILFGRDGKIEFHERRYGRARRDLGYTDETFEIATVAT